MFDTDQLEIFLRDYWTRTTFLSRVAEEDFCALSAELADFDAEVLIRRHEGEVASVWFEDANGQAQAVDLPPSEALKFYKVGMTVFLPDITTPTIERWREALSRSLGRPQHNFLASLFFSKNGNVSGCHFDHIENFTVQLRGTKTWRIMANSQAPLPTVNYSVRTERPYLEDLWLYANQPLPTGVAQDAAHVTIRPGSLLYLPRGFWHEVTASSDSASLLLGFPAFTWLDLVLPSLRTLLLRRIEWRENAVYPYNRESWQSAHDRLGRLCFQLGRYLQELDPADLLPQSTEATASSGEACSTFCRNPLCTMGLYLAEKDDVDLVATVHQGELTRAREARVPAAWRPVLESIEMSAAFTETTLAQSHPELARELPKLLRVLLSLEVIRPASAGGAHFWPDATNRECIS